MSGTRRLRAEAKASEANIPCKWLQLFDDDVAFIKQSGNVLQGKFGFADAVSFGIERKTKGGSQIGVLEVCLGESRFLQVAICKDGCGQICFGRNSIRERTVFKFGFLRNLFRQILNCQNFCFQNDFCLSFLIFNDKPLDRWFFVAFHFLKVYLL